MEGSERAVRNYVHQLGFGVSDAVRSARLGFNARNVWAYWKGLLKASLVWVLFVYAGFYAAGDSMGERFSSSLLCPLPDALFMGSVPSVVLLAAGTVLAILIMMATGLRVSRLVFQQLRGDQFFSEVQARQFCRANWKPLLLTPLTIAAGIALGLCFHALAGLIARIPAAGPVIAALLAVPLWMTGLLIVLAALVLVLCFFLVPVITAATGGDTFENLFEVFSTVTSRPLRLIRGVIAGTAIRVPALLLLAVFSWGSVRLLGAVVDASSGIPGTAASIEGGVSRAAPELVPFYSSIFSPVASTHGAGNGWTGLPGALLAAAGTSILLFLGAYWFSGCTAMWTIIYLGARHARDGEDLLLRAEEEEYREFRKIYGSTDHGGDRKAE